MNELNPKFIQRMEDELKANAHKGNWEEWQPNETQILNEMYHHMEKLKMAFVTKSLDEIKEYSADVANLAEKAFAFADKD